MTISSDDWERSTGTIWRFQVFDGLRLLDETFVPRRQMSETAAYGFLRSRVVNAMDLPIDEALAHFVNRRHGKIEASDVLAKRPFRNPEKCKQGFWIGDTNVHGIATLKLSRSTARAMIEIQEQSHRDGID